MTLNEGSRPGSLRRDLVDRDSAALDATMDRLDRDEREAERPRSDGPNPSEVLAYLRDLPRLFEQAELETRRNITRALFVRVEVLGPNDVWLHPSVEAEIAGLGYRDGGRLPLHNRKSFWSGREDFYRDV